MTEKDFITATYILQVVTPPSEAGDTYNQAVYKLEKENSRGFVEYSSIEELVTNILQNHGVTSGSNLIPNQPELRDQISALKNLVSISKERLDQLRFSMSDRVTSAMTKMILFKSQKGAELSKTENSWLEEGMKDLTQLSSALQEWTRLCELIDTSQFGTLKELNELVDTISNFEG